MDKIPAYLVIRKAANGYILSTLPGPTAYKWVYSGEIELMQALKELYLPKEARRSDE